MLQLQHWIKEARHKRMHIAWFHLYKVQKQANLMFAVRNQDNSDPWDGGWLEGAWGASGVLEQSASWSGCQLQAWVHAGKILCAAYLCRVHFPVCVYFTKMKRQKIIQWCVYKDGYQPHCSWGSVRSGRDGCGELGWRGEREQKATQALKGLMAIAS